jgi:hypothetical protein
MFAKIQIKPPPPPRNTGHNSYQYSKAVNIMYKPLEVLGGYAVAQLVEPDGRRFNSVWCHWDMSLT